MKKVMNLVIGGLQQKIFNLVLLTIVFMVTAFTVVGLYQTNSLRKLVTDANEKQMESIREISSSTMHTVVTRSLGTSTGMEAYIADGVFSSVKSEVMMLGDYAQKLFHDPGDYPQVPVPRPDPADDGTIVAQLLTEKGVDITDPEIAARIGLIGNMGDMMASLIASTDLDDCFVATPDGVFVIADDRPGYKLTESGAQKDYPVRSRFWYSGAVEKGGLYFSEIERDAFTGKIGLVCALPVYRGEELVCIVGADLFLDSMAEAVETSGDESTGFVCIVNEKGHVIFSPEETGLFSVQASDSAPDLRASEEAELADFIRKALTGNTDTALVQIGDTAYYMAGAPMETAGWAVLSIVDAESVQQSTALMQEQFMQISRDAQAEYAVNSRHSLQTIIVLLLLVFILGTAAALALARRIVSPLNTITKRIAALGGNNMLFKMEDVYRTDDEIQVLAESFACLSAKTLQYVDEVKRVTGEKERISAELNMATQIQADVLPRIFPAFPDRPELDVYASMTPAREVGGDFYDFFLIDECHIALVIADVSGKGVPAALFMMVARTLIKNCVQAGMSPARTLRRVNEQLLEGNEAELFVTVWLCVLNLSTGKGVAANAGHEHPARRDENGKYELVVYRHSLAVAAMEGVRFREHEFVMHPGDSLFVYTDGVVEATNASDEMFGTERMLEALNRDPSADPEEVLRNVMRGIHTFVAGAEQFDDITMLCMKYYGPQ